MKKSLKYFKTVQNFNYATATKPPKGGASKEKKDGFQDKRSALISDILYKNENKFNFDTIKKSYVSKDFEEKFSEQYQFIERVWALEKFKEAENYSNNLKRKYERIQESLKVLEGLDEDLFKGCLKKDVDEKGREIYVKFPVKVT
ncbi:hypothetical protein HK099_005367 [Clydaea vesicula]|uniref:Uncharacterized protein n=1 Tax=Clydaea vesicula TaxID=447962 RepID=A0AAD5U151_9FUNG|nr:hypothetical protein HK099_005367 [Clydaea vesicula]